MGSSQSSCPPYNPPPVRPIPVTDRFTTLKSEYRQLEKKVDEKARGRGTHDAPPAYEVAGDAVGVAGAVDSLGGPGTERTHSESTASTSNSSSGNSSGASVGDYDPMVDGIADLMELALESSDEEERERRKSKKARKKVAKAEKKAREAQQKASEAAAKAEKASAKSTQIADSEASKNAKRAAAKAEKAKARAEKKARRALRRATKLQKRSERTVTTSAEKAERAAQKAQLRAEKARRKAAKKAERARQQAEAATIAATQYAGAPKAPIPTSLVGPLSPKLLIPSTEATKVDRAMPLSPNETYMFGQGQGMAPPVLPARRETVPQIQSGGRGESERASNRASLEARRASRGEYWNFGHPIVGAPRSQSMPTHQPLPRCQASPPLPPLPQVVPALPPRNRHWPTTSQSDDIDKSRLELEYEALLIGMGSTHVGRR